MKRKSRRVLTEQEKKKIRQAHGKGRTWKSLCDQWAISQSTLARVLNNDYAKVKMAKGPADLAVLKPHKIQNRKPPKSNGYAKKTWIVTPSGSGADGKVYSFEDLNSALDFVAEQRTSGSGATLWEAEKREVELTARLVE